MYSKDSLLHFMNWLHGVCILCIIYWMVPHSTFLLARRHTQNDNLASLSARIQRALINNHENSGFVADSESAALLPDATKSDILGL